MRAQDFLHPDVKQNQRINVTEELRVDVPNEEWLNDAIAYAKKHSPDRNGLPYMGKTTATIRKVEVPVFLLKRIPGMRDEQQNVRQTDLAAIMKIMSDTGKLPIHAHSGEEYKPFINVAYDGSAWVNEGNHRIMAAYRLGWKELPIEISYFDGGERVESGLMYPGKIGLQGAVEGLTEVVDLDTAFPLKWDQQFAVSNRGEIHALATDTDGREIGISFLPTGDGEMIEVEFNRGGTHEMTGKGDAGKVMATVIKAINAYTKKYKPPYLVFSAKSSGGRASAYTAMIRRYAQGYKLLDTDKYTASLNNWKHFIGKDQPFVLERT